MGVFRREYSPAYLPNGQVNTQGCVKAFYFTKPGFGPGDESDTWYSNITKEEIGQKHCSTSDDDKQALLAALKNNKAIRQEGDKKAKQQQTKPTEAKTATATPKRIASSASLVSPTPRRPQKLVKGDTTPRKDSSVNEETGLSPFTEKLAEAMPRKSQSFLSEDKTKKEIAWDAPSREEVTQRTLRSHVNRMEQLLVGLSSKNPSLASSILESLVTRMNTIVSGSVAPAQADASSVETSEPSHNDKVVMDNLPPRLLEGKLKARNSSK